MLISESYFLITLDESKGKNYLRAGIAKDECFAGAWIMDLILRGKLEIEGKKLRVIDTTSTGDEYLDEVLNILYDTKMTHKTRYWVRILSFTHKITIYDLILKRLESQGVLKFEKESYLKIFKRWGYFFLQPEVKQSLLEQIRNVIINNLDPDINLLCLLSLLPISRLIKVYIPKEYRKVAKYRIDQLIRFGKYDPKHLEMIKSIKKAIKDALRGGAVHLP
ncbi:MAG: GPP34 family phosphoprotein [Candidatus Odinarchaeota archaeon]